MRIFEIDDDLLLPIVAFIVLVIILGGLILICNVKENKLKTEADGKVIIDKYMSGMYNDRHTLVVSKNGEIITFNVSLEEYYSNEIGSVYHKN